MSLFLQDRYAEFSIEQIKKFFNNTNMNYTPHSQIISIKHIQLALQTIKDYVLL